MNIPENLRKFANFIFQESIWMILLSEASLFQTSVIDLAMVIKNWDPVLQKMCARQLYLLAKDRDGIGIVVSV